MRWIVEAALSVLVWFQIVILAKIKVLALNVLQVITYNQIINAKISVKLATIKILNLKLVKNVLMVVLNVTIRIDANYVRHFLRNFLMIIRQNVK